MFSSGRGLEFTDKIIEVGISGVDIEPQGYSSLQKQNPRLYRFSLMFLYGSNEKKKKRDNVFNIV
jgi:hypothetical protein